MTEIMPLIDSGEGEIAGLQIKITIEDTNGYAVFTFFSEDIPLVTCFLNWGENHQELWQYHILPFCTQFNVRPAITDAEGVFLAVIVMPTAILKPDPEIMMMSEMLNAALHGGY